MLSTKYTSIILLTLSCVNFSTRARSQPSCEENNAYLPGCICYSVEEVNTLAGGIVELKKCEAVLLEKDRLIAERITDFKGPQENRLWWQDPAFFGYSIFGSFVLGLVTAKMIQK